MSRTEAQSSAPSGTYLVFKVSQQELYTLIRCPLEMSTKAAAEITERSPVWAASMSRLFILDFSATQVLHHSCYRPLALFQREVKKRGLFLCSIKVRMPLVKQARSDGMDVLLNPKGSIDECLAYAGITRTRPRIDVQFINPFVRSTVSALQVQAGTPCQMGKPFLKNDSSFKSDLVCLVSLKSRAFQGNIALSFPGEVILGIYSRMMGEEHTAITKEVEDGAGELLNIIFGPAKDELNELDGYSIQQAIPTVIAGRLDSVTHMTRNLAIILPFTTEFGEFRLEISLDETS